MLQLVSLATVSLGLATAAPAADLPMKAVYQAFPGPSPAAVAPFRWSGFSIGAYGGHAWTPTRWSLPGTGPVVRYSADDWMGGGQLGFDWQTGNWVVGSEAEVGFGQIRFGATWVDPDPEPWVDPEPNPRQIRQVRTGTTVERLGTIAARFGRGFGHSLVFGKAGVAWAHDIYRALDPGVSPERLLASASGTRWGFMLGIGYAYAVTAHWSARIEYDYLGLGDKRTTLVAEPGVTPATRDLDVRQTVSLVRLGINYRFGR